MIELIERHFSASCNRNGLIFRRRQGVVYACRDNQHYSELPVAAYLHRINPAPSKGRSEQLFVTCGAVGFLILYRLLNWFGHVTSFPPERIVIAGGPSWDVIRRARCVSPCCNAFSIRTSASAALCRSHPRDSRANALDTQRPSKPCKEATPACAIPPHEHACA